MKVMLLVDLLNNWALHNRAKAIKKYLPEFEIDIWQGLEDEKWIQQADRYDLIHFNFSYGVTDFHKFFFEHIDRCIMTVVNERSLFSGHGVDVPTFARMLRECKNLTSVSMKIAEIFPNAVYIPNGIDEDLFFKRKKPVVGYAGVADKSNKNVSSIIDACETLGLDFKIAAYDRQDRYTHSYRLDQMQDFYNSVDVYVHASLTEGFNNTVIEALSCNVPVIMTKEGCWREFEGWVEFVEPNAQSIENALKKFVGRNLIEGRFTWKKLIPEYKKVYEQAFARAQKISRNPANV